MPNTHPFLNDFDDIFLEGTQARYYIADVERLPPMLQEDVHIKTVEGELQMTKKKLEVESRREELVIYQNDPPDLSSSRFREDPNLDFLKGC